MSVPGSSQIQFPSILNADFAVDQVTDPAAPRRMSSTSTWASRSAVISISRTGWRVRETSPSTPTSSAAGITKRFSRQISPSQRTRRIHRAPRNPLDADLPHRPAIQLDTAFRSFASAGFDGVQPRRRLHLQRCALGHRSVRGHGDLHDQLSSSIFFIASSSRKSLTQVRGSGMAAAASPGPGPGVQKCTWRWTVSGR